MQVWRFWQVYRFRSELNVRRHLVLATKTLISITGCPSYLLANLAHVLVKHRTRYWARHLHREARYTISRDKPSCKVTNEGHPRGVWDLQEVPLRLIVQIYSEGSVTFGPLSRSVAVATRLDNECVFERGMRLLISSCFIKQLLF